VAARTREVVWAEAARSALDEVLNDIARESPDGAGRVLTWALEAAASLRTLADRGRIVPEVRDEALRELFVHNYRLLYRNGEASG
jgi:plasmid stabilization system protein ParE